MSGDDALPSPAALVVGGGPAGLFLAGSLAARLREVGLGAEEAPVLLLEKGPKPGRKLLASGAGRCNLTNSGPIEDFLPRYGERGRFLRRALTAFDNAALVAWFVDRGLDCVAEEGGKVFPASGRALDVLSVLRAECASLGVRTACGRRVSSLAPSGTGGFLVGLRSAEPGGDRGESSISSPRVALTTGGRSYPALGSEGEGYALAAALGHRIVEPRPALTALLSSEPSLEGLEGLAFEACRFALRRGGRKLGDYSGPVLVTHEGLSGPGILDASRDLRAGDLLELDFSALGREGFKEALMKSLAASPRSQVRVLLGELGLPRRLALRLCTLAGLAEDCAAATLRREAREALVTLASAFPVKVDALAGWERAMVTAGGVDCSEVSSATLESRLAPGLWFAGEILDIDGDTGGFNLQAAFSTARLAAGSMAASILAAPALPPRLAPSADAGYDTDPKARNT